MAVMGWSFLNATPLEGVNNPRPPTAPPKKGKKVGIVEGAFMLINIYPNHKDYVLIYLKNLLI